MGYCSAIKKGWNNAICSNTDGPRDCHTEWRKSQISCDTTHMEIFFLMVQMCLFAEQKRVMDVGNRLVVAKEELGGDKLGDWDWDIHATVYKIDNKDLQYSTGNSILCNDLSKNMCVCIDIEIYLYMTDSLRYTPETNTTL